MTQRLTDMEIDKVSLVDRGANQLQIALLKRDEPGPVKTPEELAELWKAADAADPVVARKGLLAKLAEFLGVGSTADVSKSSTFASIIAGRQLTDALWDSWYTLEDSLWSAVWAVDANGADLSLDAKKALVAQNLDEFKAWLLGQMDDATAVAKRDVPGPVRGLEALLRKAAGDDTARGTALSKAAEPLMAAIGVMGSSDPEVTKRADAQEEAMTGEELETIRKTIADAVKPIADDVALLKAAAQPASPTPPAPPAPAPVTKTEDQAGEIPESIGKILEVLIEDVAALKAAPGQRQSLDGQAEAPVAKGQSWTAGIL